MLREQSRPHDKAVKGRKVGQRMRVRLQVRIGRMCLYLVLIIFFFLPVHTLDFDYIFCVYTFAWHLDKNTNPASLSKEGSQK